MLLWLAQFFQQDVGSLRVFGFISFRAVFATLTALTIGLIAGPAVIRLLTKLKVGQAAPYGWAARRIWSNRERRQWAAC